MNAPLESAFHSDSAGLGYAPPDFVANYQTGGAHSALAGALAQLGLPSAVRADGSRFDAVGDTMYLARELEYVSAETYEVLYDPIIGRSLVDFEAVPDGAEFFSYDMYDGFAKAEFISNWNSQVGQADAFKTRTTKPMKAFGGSYQYTVNDLLAAQMAGGNARPLDRERARHNRVGHEQKLDDIIAVGDTTRAFEGLTNSSNIPTIVRAGSHTWTGGSVTVADIHADLTKLAQAPEQASEGNIIADTLVLPLSQKPLLSQPYSSLNGESILSVWLKGQQDIKRVVFWARLNTAAASGTGPRALAFKAGKMYGSFLMAFDYRELPPQPVNFAFVINTWAKVGGFCLKYAFAYAKMDLDV